MAKKRKYTKKRSKTSKVDLTIVALILISILLAVLIYTKSGVIGVQLNEVLGGMMGISRLLLPVGILGIAIKLACADNEYVTSKLVKFRNFINKHFSNIKRCTNFKWRIKFI